MAVWLQHCEPKLDAARDEGEFRLAHGETRHILRIMKRHLSVTSSSAREGGLYINVGVIGAGKDVLPRNAGNALRVARALLQQPNTYQDGHSYYITSTSHNALQDHEMRWRSALVILLLRDEESIPFLREAQDRRRKVTDRVLRGDLRTSDRSMGGVGWPGVSMICGYVLDRLENGDEVYWNHRED